MKKTALTLLLLITAAAVPAAAQNTIAYWAQNDNSTGSLFGFTPDDFPQAADVGWGWLTLEDFDATTVVNSDGATVYSTIESFTGTTLNALPGFSAGGSISPEGSVNNGMSIIIDVSTIGYESISISWAQRGTATGFSSREFSYSVDGGTSYNVFDVDSGTLGATWQIQSYDLTSVVALENLSQVLFKITLDGASSASGNNRFDNILVSGSLAAIPEPSTIGALLGVLALGFATRRRRPVA